MNIHELNNFTGTLGSGAYLAIDDGTDTGKISSQGLLAATEARIDNIIAGPAPSAEEIVDARLGADGVTYPSLGDAIRDQFTDVKSELNRSSVEINLCGVFLDYFYTGDQTGASSKTSLKYDISNATEIHLVRPTYNNYNIYTFLDASDNIISYNKATSTGTFDAKLPVPTNAKYIVCSSNSKWNLTDVSVIAKFLEMDTTEYTRLFPRKLKEFYTDGIKSTTTSYQSFAYNLPDEAYLIKVSGDFATNYDFCTFLASNDSVLAHSMTIENKTNQTAYCFVPSGSKKLYVSNSAANLDGMTIKVYAKSGAYIVKNVQYNRWTGKSIVWLGTSIPCGDRFNNPDFAYPAMVGEMLGATVYNEAVGNSSVHTKSPEYITEDNPSGIHGKFIHASRCLTNSLEEMEWIIDNFNDTSIFIDPPASLSDADKEFIRDCSWERKLSKYFGDNFPDLWIIDHGHNDLAGGDADEDYYDAGTEMTGTSEQGFYSHGSYVSDTHYMIKSFDVSGMNGDVRISGHFRRNYDWCLLKDGDDIIRYETASADEDIDQFIDVTDATTLYVSNNIAEVYMPTVSVVRPIASEYNNLYCFQGGMDFIINKIKNYNPRAEIVMIGEYENQKLPQIAEYQTIVADRWEFPLFKEWDYLGWSQRLIRTTGYWNSGIWIPSGGTFRQMSYLDLWLADGVHPHSDLSGRALHHCADYIAGWMKTL